LAIDRLARVAGISLLLSGCTLGPNFEQPNLFAPSTWFTNRTAPKLGISRTVPEPVDPNWWRLFKDPQLTSLEERVAASNLNVRLYTIRLTESRSQRGITASDQFPNLNGNSSYTREKISNRGVAGLFGGGSTGGTSQTTSNGLGGTVGGIPSVGISAGKPGGIPPFNLFQYGFDASWELDLWGRVQREVESADATVESSVEARRNMLLSVVAELARDYLQLRGQQRDLQIAKENLATEQQTLSLTRQRAAGGLTTDLDVANASAQVATTGSQIPQLEQGIAASINAISLLLGKPPRALVAELGTTKPVPPVPPTVPVGLPSELARRRPDIRQAEAQLHSATADIGVAEADFFPKVTLSGSIGIQTTRFKDLGNWDSRMYSGGPTISIPLFEGGRLKYTLELRKTQQQEAATNYQQTVLQAFHDVDNALTAYAAEQRRRTELNRAVEQSRRAVGLARDQYTQGMSSFLDVLNAQRSLLLAEQQYADSTTTLSTNLVQLYKALGGGWEHAFPRGNPSEKTPKLP